MIASLATLGACQFQPALGPGSAAGSLFNNVSFTAPNSTDSFVLVEQLQKRLGIAESPNWNVTYKIGTSSQAFSGSDSRRVQLMGDVSFELTSSVNGQGTIRDKVSGFVNYTEARSSATQTGMLLSNRSAKSDAQRRLMVLLADRMVDRMIVELARTKR